MDAKQIDPKYPKQGLASKLDRIGELEESTAKCLERLKILKPMSYHENEVVGLLKQILENQARLSKITGHVIKYVYRRT